MDLTAYENAIVARLKDQIDNIAVESFPDNPQDYQLNHAKGAILVKYENSDYSEPEPNKENVLVQERTLNWSFYVCKRSLKLKDAHQGIYETLEAIRAALSGWTPTGFSDVSVLWPQGDNFEFEDDGFWWYRATFQCLTMESEA